MATAQKAIINRIQGHRSRIASMLTPGLKRPDAQSSARLSPVSAQFGGEKFKLAAKEMRVLDANKLGRSQTESRKNFAEAIPNKFRDVQKLIHVSPSFSKDVSIWSELEKTLPGKGSSDFQAPPQPGELRQGSVIQQFSMFPKQGQSIESFRKQAQSIPKPKKRKTPAPQPKLAPKSRMFARIQEVTDHDQVSDEIPLEISETPEERQIETPTDIADSVQRQPETPPTSELLDLDIPLDQGIIELPVPIDDVISQPEPESQIEPDPEPEPQPEPRQKTAKPVKKDRLGKPVLRQLRTAKPALKKDKSIVSGTSLLQAKPSLPSQQVVQRKLDKPAPQKPLKLALPPRLRPVLGQETKEDMPAQAPRPKVEEDATPQTILPKLGEDALPQAIRPKPAADAPPPTIRPESEVDALARALRPKSERVAPPQPLRPKLEEDAPPQILRSEPKKETPPQSPSLKPKEEAASEISPAEPKDSASMAQPPITSPEMTLRKRIESHKRVGEAMKSLQPERLIHRAAPPVQIRQDHPMISSDKYRPAPKKADVPEEPVDSPFAGFIKSQPQPVPDLLRRSEPKVAPVRPPQPEDGLAEPIFAVPSAQTETPMSLTHARLPSRAAPQASPRPASLPSSTTSPLLPIGEERLFPTEEERLPPTEEERLPQPPTPEPGAAIVQSFGEDDDAGFQGDEIVRRESEKGEASSPKDSGRVKLNLDQLAEDVLPLVKRILEIESERLSSNLR